MKFFDSFKPREGISERELTHGLRWSIAEGTASLGIFNITTSGLLAAFALALGANNLEIGILAALPFIMQIIQIPAIVLVEKVRRRKAIAVGFWAPAQLMWFLVALVPVFVTYPSHTAVMVLLVIMTVRGLLAATTSAAWNGWMRDLIPPRILGKTFSRRMALGTLLASVFGLGSAFFIDYWRGQVPANEVILGYTYVILAGALFMGVSSVPFMAMVPELRMHPTLPNQPSLLVRLVAPLRDTNFRRLIQFLFTWGFASNIAIPFFAVYMLTVLKLSLTWVIGLSMVGQFFNIFFYRVWGTLADRFGIKSVLSLSASLYLLVILGWTFTKIPNGLTLIALLVLLQMFTGIANAGVTLSTSTIGMKIAPKGEATPYLTAASLATNLGQGLGPLFGGISADFFLKRKLDLTFNYISPGNSLQAQPISLAGYDFLFAIAFVLGLITLGFLARLHEEGSESREVVLESLMSPAREMSRPLSSLPLSYLKRVPLPGLDVAVGVTVYQIAEMAKMATLAAVGGHKLTKKLAKNLSDTLARIWRTEEEYEEQRIEVTRQAARGAMHAMEAENLDVEELEEAITTALVKISHQAGARPADALQSISQGIILGAAEVKLDPTIATQQAIKAAKKVASMAKLSPQVAESRAKAGILKAAETLPPEIQAKIKQTLTEIA